MVHNKKIFTGLNPSQYEHPFDRKTLEALEKTPGLGLVGKYVTKHTIERFYRVQYTGSNLKINGNNYSWIYDYLEYACKILDVKTIPDLYMDWNYSVDASVVGFENPIVVLNSGLIDLCKDDEIMFVVGHQIGHLKSEHLLYHLIAQVFNYIIDQIPFGNIASAPLQLALYYWKRMSEYTADRAGLLACQDKDAAIRALMKMAGLPVKEFGNIKTETFIQQAHDFKGLDYDGMNKVVKFLSIADESHPWTVMRSSELLKWIEDGGYDKFLSNRYLK